MKNFTEKMLYKILKGNLCDHFGGIYNGLLDGHYTESEYDDMTTEEEFLNMANYFLKNAYKIGYLESEYDNIAMEAKHIKFLGKEKIDMIIKKAVEKAMQEF